MPADMSGAVWITDCEGSRHPAGEVLRENQKHDRSCSEVSKRVWKREAGMERVEATTTTRRAVAVAVAIVVASTTATEVESANDHVSC